MMSIPANVAYICKNKETRVKVKNVKANICENCGEAYFDSETVNYIQIKTKEAMSSQEDVELFNV